MCKSKLGFVTSIGRALIVLGCGVNLSSCGGGAPSTTSPPPAPNPVPTIAAISPNGSEQSGPALTLSVVGSNFLSSSVVQWNGSSLSTTFITNELITAAVPASSLTAAGAQTITVVNSAPGGGASNSMSFAIPCAIPSLTAAAGQTTALLGAYYFDGWSGPLTNFHFQGLPLGPYQDRQPFSAWQDVNPCSVEQQLATAHNFGIDFFVFDWYYNVQVNDPGENLNSGLQITHSPPRPSRHGVRHLVCFGAAV